MRRAEVAVAVAAAVAFGGSTLRAVSVLSSCRVVGMLFHLVEVQAPA